MRPVLFALSLSLSLGPLACAGSRSAATGPRLSAGDYAPYAEGASWVNQANFMGQTSERKVTVLRKKDGFWLDDAGGRFQLTASGLRDPKRYLIQAPIEVGHSWKAVLSVSAVERYRIRSVGKPCQSPAGRFEDCLVVEAKLSRGDKLSLNSRFTWARGVGLVRVETETEAKGGELKPQTKIELLRYQLPAQGRAEAPGRSQG